MKKIIAILLLLGASIIFITCDRNDLYDNAKNDTLSLLASLYNLNNGGGTTTIPPTTPPTVIYLYSAGTRPNGNLGGRAGANATCITAGPPVGTTTVQAFLSVSASDQIRDLVPSIYQTLPVVDAGGAMTIANTWNDLWTIPAGLNMSLADAGVLGPGAEWWSGSNLDGTFNANNCNSTGGWTSGSSIVTGWAGNSNAPTLIANSLWINFGTLQCDSWTTNLLCVAY